jgi:Regulator of ribonuclease activity B
MHLTREWPNDADGGVFRRLEEHRFDFSKSHTVDYNVDFAQWPPAHEAVVLLESMYGAVVLYDPSEHGDGYAQFRIFGPLTYEGVISVQQTASVAMQRYGGICDSWGVMQEAP